VPKGRNSHIKDRKKPAGPEEDPSEMTIPICFGDFTTSDAERVKSLWERTWSQDARDKGDGGKGKK
jgi:hypothetical protein